MADGGLDSQGFTIKDWLQRIDSKQDKMDEKIDSVQAALDHKADDRDVRALTDRLLVVEQQGNQRLDLWKALTKRVDTNTDRLETLREQKAERTDVGTLWRILIGALSGAALSILAWALTVFGGAH